MDEDIPKGLNKLLMEIQQIRIDLDAHIQNTDHPHKA